MEILEKHPEIAELFNKPEWRTKWYILATVLIQTCMAMYVADKSWPVFIAAAYIIGATCHQSLFVCVHELSHYLSAQSKFWCRSHSILANLPIGIPFVATFEPYHYDHHRFQGMFARIRVVILYRLISTNAFRFFSHHLSSIINSLFQFISYLDQF
jgi:sphingolipid delta-4 desaturase